MEFQYRIKRANQDHPIRPPSTNQQQRRTREQIQSYQHHNMLRQDYYGLFYRNVNTIIQLEALQQTQIQVQSQINQLSPVEDCLKTNRFAEEYPQKASPVILTAKEAVKYHSRMRKQEGLQRKKNELQLQVDKLRDKRKAIVQIIRSLAIKWMNRAIGLFDNEECSQLQERVLEAGKKYNLSKVLCNFMSELKEILVCNWAIDMLSDISKNEPGFKIQELKLATGRGQKQSIANLTLYLKEFYSSNIFKQLNDLISHLSSTYQASRTITSLDLNQLAAQIRSSLDELAQLARTIASRQGTAMDLKIDIEITSEEIKLIEKRLWSYQRAMELAIQRQAIILVEEYQNARKYEGTFTGDGSGPKSNKETNNFQYFYAQLTIRYKQFTLQHLKRSQMIEYLEYQIEQNNMMIQQREQEINRQKGLVSHSESGSVMLQPSLEDIQRHKPDSVMETNKIIMELQQSIQQEPVQSFEEGQSLEEVQSLEEEQIYQMPLQTFRSNQQQQPKITIHQDHKSRDPAQSLEETPTLKGCQDQKENQLFPKVNAFVKSSQKRERFIARKSLIIGSSSNKTSKLGDKDDYRQFQVKLTKKYLIIQPLDQQALSVNEKIELSRVKSYSLNLQKRQLKLDYGGCVLELHFITFNLDSFGKKLAKLGIKAGNNHQKVKHR